MKTLVVYYSRSGNTREVAQSIAQEMQCDIEEIHDTQNRSGLIGWLKSAYQANRGKLTTIGPLEKDPLDYDLIVVGTPIWAGFPAVPVKTYLIENKDKFKNVAFFATYGGSGFPKAVRTMGEASGKEPVQKLGIKTDEIKNKTCDCKIDPFVRDLG
jgi:flavodoxin